MGLKQTVWLTDNQVNALRRLQQGLEHHDSFEGQPDDCPIFIEGKDDSLYELPYDNGRMKVGDLRDLASILETE